MSCTSRTWACPGEILQQSKFFEGWVFKMISKHLHKRPPRRNSSLPREYICRKVRRPRTVLKGASSSPSISPCEEKAQGSVVVSLYILDSKLKLKVPFVSLLLHEKKKQQDGNHYFSNDFSFFECLENNSLITAVKPTHNYFTVPALSCMLRIFFFSFFLSFFL